MNCSCETSRFSEPEWVHQKISSEPSVFSPQSLTATWDWIGVAKEDWAVKIKMEIAVIGSSDYLSLSLLLSFSFSFSFSFLFKVSLSLFPFLPVMFSLLVVEHQFVAELPRVRKRKYPKFFLEAPQELNSPGCPTLCCLMDTDNFEKRRPTVWRPSICWLRDEPTTSSHKFPNSPRFTYCQVSSDLDDPKVDLVPLRQFGQAPNLFRSPLCISQTIPRILLQTVGAEESGGGQWSSGALGEETEREAKERTKCPRIRP